MWSMWIHRLAGDRKRNYVKSKEVGSCYCHKYFLDVTALKDMFLNNSMMTIANIINYVLVGHNISSGRNPSYLEEHTDMNELKQMCVLDLMLSRILRHTSISPILPSSLKSSSPFILANCNFVVVLNYCFLLST